MSKGRTERLKDARIWWKEQHFSKGDPVLKAYRKHFGVDRICAMRDLLKMGVLDDETKETYRQTLRKREEHLASKRERKARREEEKRKEQIFGSLNEDWQDGDLFFIAGFTEGGFPYGLTREEALWMEDEDADANEETEPMDDPEYLDYLEGVMENNPPDDRDLPFP